MELHIHWADGRPSKVIELFRSPHFHRLVLQWHIEGVSPQVMVERLAAMRVSTQQGNPWSIATIKSTLAISVRRARESGNHGEKEIPPVRRDPVSEMVDLHANGLAPPHEISKPLV